MFIYELFPTVVQIIFFNLSYIMFFLCSKFSMSFRVKGKVFKMTISHLIRDTVTSQTSFVVLLQLHCLPWCFSNHQAYPCLVSAGFFFFLPWLLPIRDILLVTLLTSSLFSNVYLFVRMFLTTLRLSTSPSSHIDSHLLFFLP